MRIFDFFFGCRHAELSRVFTIGGQSYCVCWSCGSRFVYSLASMRMGRRLVEMPLRLPSRTAQTAAIRAAGRVVPNMVPAVAGAALPRCGPLVANGGVTG